MRYPKRSQYKYAKSRYRIRNWPEYEAGLRNRSDLNVCSGPPIPRQMPRNWLLRIFRGWEYSPFLAYASKVLLALRHLSDLKGALSDLGTFAALRPAFSRAWLSSSSS